MKQNKLNDQELNNASGGIALEKYLKSLEGNDKNILEDKDTGVQLDLNPSISYDEPGNLYINKREEDKPECITDVFNDLHI